MKVVVVDITSRNAEQYNPSLCKALAYNLPEGEVVLMAPDLYRKPEGFIFKRLINLLPKKWSASEAGWKRIIRAMESLLNYLYLIIYIAFSRPDILHIQWLPFIEFMSMEHGILSVIHFVNPKIKIVLTAHNIYPHNLSQKNKEEYQRRFKQLNNVINGYMVHLYSAKTELASEFDIHPEKIFVAYHGIYLPEGYSAKQNIENGSYKRIIMFGTQNRYKGADVLIEAMSLLPKGYQDKLKVTIMGKTEVGLYGDYIERARLLGVEWINKFVPDEELYQAIGESDLILLPYRKISQSGVLLLALSYRKPILTSDLPSFRETLEGYPKGYFFKPDNSQALADMLIQYLDGKIDVKLLKNCINYLNSKYSWNESAKSTLVAYSNIL